MEKILKPNFVKKKFLENGFNDFIQGVKYNPFKNRWSVSERTFINYMFYHPNLKTTN